MLEAASIDQILAKPVSVILRDASQGCFLQ